MTERGGDELTIREATPDDIPALKQLWFAAATPNEAAESHRLLMDATGADPAQLYVGVTDRGVVASARGTVDDRTGWLSHVVVHPAVRRRGYGRRMVRAIEAWLAEHGALDVRAAVAVPLGDALPFARALGYGQLARATLGRSLTRGASPDAGQDAAQSVLELTVTFLEMTQRPRHQTPHPPPGRRVAFMRAERPTVSFYRFLYNAVGGSCLWWERRAMSDDALAGLVQDPRSEIYVLYVEGAPAGFVELEHWRPPTINLAYIGLLPEYRGHGLGRYLFGAAVDMAWAHDPAKVTVVTNTMDHPNALPLYQRMGFEPVKREVWRMHDPRVLGLIAPDEANH